MGRGSKRGGELCAGDEPVPQDPYSIYKMEADQGLREIAAQTAMEVLVIRPPLVYGPGVKTNVVAMMRWQARRVPLSLDAATHNCASQVVLDNLVDLIVTCINHAAAANQAFWVSDAEHLSIADLLRHMCQALAKPVRLLLVPAALLKHGAVLLSKPELAQRLTGMGMEGVS